MVLYFGQMRGLWGEGLKLNLRDSNGAMKLVQMWTAIWDYRFSASCYLTLEDHFFQPLYTLFGHHSFPSISLDIKRFLRPRDNGLGDKIKHNWGDWYAYDYFACIRVFGFKGRTYRLPTSMPNRIAYLEIVRQMSKSSKQHFKDKQRKKTFLLATLSFGDFIICATNSYGNIGEKL